MNKYMVAAEKWTDIMENKFHIGPFKFGLDALLGLVPGGGDTLSAVLSLYLLWIASKLDVPAHILRRMIFNIALDMAIGMIPVLGDAGDFIYKSNVKNLELLKKYSNTKSNIIEA